MASILCRGMYHAVAVLDDYCLWIDAGMVENYTIPNINQPLAPEVQSMGREERAHNLHLMARCRSPP